MASGIGSAPGASAIASSVGGGLVTKNKLMGSLSFQFDFKPSVGIFAGGIDKLGVDIRSFKEPLTRAVKEVMIPSIRTNFEVSGRPSWPPLSDYTWAARGARGWEGGDILMLSGELYKTMQQQNIWTITQQSASIRDIPERVWYGKVHQAGAGGGGGGAVRKLTNSGRKARRRGGLYQNLGGGGSTGRGYVNIPARPFVLIQPEDHEAIQEIFREWLQERVDRWWN